MSTLPYSSILPLSPQITLFPNSPHLSENGSFEAKRLLDDTISFKPYILFCIILTHVAQKYIID